MDPQLAFHLDTVRPLLPLGDLTEEERAVGRALRWGRAGARQVPDLAQETGIPERRVQEIVRQLLHEHGWPIGTAMSSPFGNYLIDNAAELEATVELLRVRGISNLARAAALRRMSLKRYLATLQTELASLTQDAG